MSEKEASSSREWVKRGAFKDWFSTRLIWREAEHEHKLESMTGASVANHSPWPI